MRFDGPSKLRFTGQHDEPKQRFDAADRMLGGLSRCVTKQ
jgi:hypothetical protein